MSPKEYQEKQVAFSATCASVFPRSRPPWMNRQIFQRESYDRRAAAGSGNSTRSNLAGRRTPSGSGEAVPPSLVTKATLPNSLGSLLHAALVVPIMSVFLQR
jgi:hypothetical protein